MNFNKASGASFRSVGTSERDGKPTRIVKAGRSYPTSPKDLWSALTEKERICRWFAEVEGDFKPGGRYAIKHNAEGEIMVCEPPRTLALTWEYSGNVSWVTVTIEETDDGAQLTLEHEMPTDPASEAHWAKYGPAATGIGWDLSFIGLDVHLASGGQSTIEAGTAWAEDSQGKAMMRTWAEEWKKAHIAAGEPEESATAIADRTAGFFTGES